MGKVFVIDPAKCNGCHNCQIACKDEHCDRAWPPYAAAEPDTGQFWMKVEEHVRGSVPKVMISYVAKPCMHCEDAPCMKAAQDGAVYRREDGLVIVDPEKSKGQRAIVDACPYGAVYWNDALEIPQKCTGCAHLLDDGWSVPRCVDMCATGALRFGDEEDFAEEIAQAEYYPCDSDCAPRVYYLNYPKRFVAGEVYDLEADEVVIGAAVTLTDEEGTEMGAVDTDDFGDFWFKQIPAKRYMVTIEAEGYLPRTVAADASGEDVNIGAIELFKL
ncbi:4Fe-4S dicluster domain-containing protein [Adlercreutzia sp. R25]|uniref:4Fe-4S dicluster domain-containing protein n=1 Tax=Adlercreutzia shanghongiae TaxID=3111773 RepID=UPI002DBAC9C3|nr:4Fe-4S dicluster domain-containing protein [Adlercreutzia sp. R25]MEC4271860.1 4Fe-4S dicluster domain-containing protein [Adlercreutzia sp. R25]